MATDEGHEQHDYTEGASNVEISAIISSQQPIPRARRDSQVGSAYDDDGGAVFDGEGSVVIPSSITNMRRERSIDWGGRRRRSISRGRRSMDSSRPKFHRKSSGGDEEQAVASPTRDIEEFALTCSSPEQETSPEDDRISRHSRISGSRRHRRRKASVVVQLPEPLASSSVFENIGSFFAGRSAVAQYTSSAPRRSSLSHRSSASSNRSRRRLLSDGASESEAVSDGEERWGYSSGEEDDESEDDDASSRRHYTSDEEDVGLQGHRRIGTSRSPSPTSSLPPMPGETDVFAQDTRLEIGEFPPEDDFPPPPPGPPSRQTIHLADDDSTIRLVGREIVVWKKWAWRVACILSAGVLGLIGIWIPGTWLKWVTEERGFQDLVNGVAIVQTPNKEFEVQELQTIRYEHPFETAFPDVPKSAPAMPYTNGNANGNGHTSTTPSDGAEILSVLRMFDYRYSRFVMNPKTGTFNMIRDWRDPSWKSCSLVQKGLDSVTRAQRDLLFGDNMVNIKSKSVLTLLIDEVLHPFYVFQIASIILWSIDDYYYYAFCIALISVSSVVATLIETKRTIERMREVSKFSCPVSILADGTWQIVDSSKLVPGDIIDLASPLLAVIPADLLLLSGDTILNESMLTGESIPVSKTPINDDDLAKWKEGGDVTVAMAKGLLYAGTQVVRTRGNIISGQALALVARTGFNTTKGSLVRSMLFPKPIGFKFYRDSMRFIVFLAGIAGLGFIASAFQFIALGIPATTIFIRALDLITVVVPPALPATLSIGTSFSVGRLRKMGIFCISPSRVNVSGKVNVVCLDKTGTLTEDGLDILGIRSLDRTGSQFGELISEVNDLPLGSGAGKASFLYALATCHSLKVVDGEVIGDPLDAKMFEFTRWTLEEGQIGPVTSTSSKPRPEGRTIDRPSALVQIVARPPGTAHFRLEDALKSGTRHAHFLELGVIRTFEFVSSLRRMSVIVKRLKSASMEIYVKGAPEVMTDICAKDSLPSDYEEMLNYYTKHGYRVIAMAGKSLEGLSWLKAQRMRREQAESGLRFLGLIIFENKLKPGTTPAIQTLRAAHFACRMVTGDNPLTAVSVGRECGLVSQSAHVFSPTFIQGGTHTARSRIEWSSVDDPNVKLDHYTLKPPPRDMADSDEMPYHDYGLVVTGDVFRWMINYAPVETLQRMLVKAQIFARMSPDEKHELVERLQSLGYTVAFCGDGANDSAALAASDVGISLSEQEASLAAPFTSRTPDISCVIDVIREGRAALVTSFSCFKYMALYSLIQFTTITLLYSFASSLGDFQFLYIDLFIIIPIAVTMGRTLPYPHLHPKGPTASLVSKKVLSSIISQIIATSAFQFWVFFWTRAQPWYKPPPKEPVSDGKLEILNFENTVLFLVSCFQYILVAAVFSIGPPYRKPMWSNGWLMASFVVLTTLSTVILLSPPQSLTVLLELMPIPLPSKLTLFAVVVGNAVLSTALERWAPVGKVVTFVSKKWKAHSRHRRRGGNPYKAVESGMNG